MGEKMTQTVADLLDELASVSAMIGYATSGAERNNHKAMRDKIKAEILAHLTQPAQAVDVGAAEAVLDALDKAAESQWGRHIAWHGFRDEDARVAVVQQALAAITPAKVYVCTGCDRIATDPGADLLTMQADGAMTCCPDRQIVRREVLTAALPNANGKEG